MMEKSLIRNPYLILSFCLVFAYVSAYAVDIDPTMYIVVFILMAITTFLIRPLSEVYLKSTAYLSLGMLSYWMIAREIIVSPAGPTPAIAILFGLAILNGLVALVAYTDGKTSGHAFSAGALALLFLNLQNPQAFFSGALIYIASHTVVYFISKIRTNKQIPEAVIKAAVLSSILLYLSAIFQLWSGIACGVYVLPSDFIFGSSIIYLIAISAFAIWITLWVFEFFLGRFNYVRDLEDDVVLYYPVTIAPHKKRQKKKGAKKKK
ncbi:MAG: hypothetical protein ABIG39_03100 [Candidatus Micrarchaeota archaeon]